MNSTANPNSTGRAAALARRKAMSSKGKQAVAGRTQERTRAGEERQRPVAATQVAAGVSAAPAALSAPAPAPAAPVPAPIRAHGGAQAPTPSSSSRAQARARRAALSQSGRRAQSSNDRVRDGDRRATGAAQPPERTEERKEGCNCAGQGERTLQTPVPEPTSRLRSPAENRAGTRVRRNGTGAPSAATARLVARARRSAMSARGKAASDTPTSAAGLARQANPRLSSRELAQKVREHRSRNGASGARKSQSAGRIRAERRKGSAADRSAQDQPWKVGASETAHGQTITGTAVARSTKTTGNEQATCRAVTGTEYLGAEIFRAFCQAEPTRTSATKVAVSATSRGNAVTGNEVGRSAKVTGDEPGACKSVTGTEYLAAGHFEAFCQSKPGPAPAKGGQTRTLGGQPLSGTQVGRAAKVTGDEHGADVRPTGTQYTDAQSIQNGAVGNESSAPVSTPVPPKVGTSVTLSGGTVTGTRVGRSAKVTGDEPGSCRVITGDEYTDLGQYQSFCGTSPEPEPAKVGLSLTGKRQSVSGTRTGRAAKVTGDEPGTCKAVTGTPYAGLEQAAEWCEPGSQRAIAARTRQLAATPGPSMTGIQPGIGGVATGDARGACEPVSGTPYVGQDQFAAACAGSSGAAPGDGDFPRPLEASDSTQGNAPWQSFSVTSPAREAFAAEKQRGNVTGTRYETGMITGPFDMGAGKITGTEQFRFDANRGNQGPSQPSAAVIAEEPAAADTVQPPAAPRARVTGEGQSAGSKITGDDWDRGEHVTGTEGASAKRRNPTRPGPMSAMPPVGGKRNEEVPEPVSRVTGSSGSTERGALVTYSGGARG